MKFIFSSNTDLITNFEDSIFNNLPCKDGLWLPRNIPQLSQDTIENLDNFNFKEIAKIVLLQYIDEIEVKDLEQIIEESFYFEPKLNKFEENKYILELFHGPSLAFKDFGASFMANLYQYYEKNGLNILTATSGDTGAAVANAFYAKKNIKVFILYPKGKVSILQEKQMTTFGKNIYPIEINGTFDDCQLMVKKIFENQELVKKLNIVSANSINIARLLPQTLYYFYMYSELIKKNKNKNLIVSVPSGNLGNITAGIIAKKMGLPIRKFIVAVNKNDTFYQYLKTNKYLPKQSVKTLSNAMDVGNPSNFLRLDYFYKSNKEMNKDIECYSIDDINTINNIKQFYQKYNYILDPHTAVAYGSLKEYQETSCEENQNFNYVLVSTAHPAKFKTEIEYNTNIKVDLPFELSSILNKKSIKYPIKIFDDLIPTIQKYSANNENITLIGMPYSGKSTFGKELEKLTNKKLIDTDQLIEKKYQMKLIDILNKYGNQKFLDIEAEVIQEIKEDNLIISTGGSVIYRENAMNHLNSMLGHIYYLEVPYDEIERRCNKLDSRGVVLEEGQTLFDLYKQRIPLYKKYSNFILKESTLQELNSCRTKTAFSSSGFC